MIRARKGDKVELVNGRGALAQAVVTTLEKEKAPLQIESTTEKPRGAEIILAQALPRFSHLDWIIEKGTELGASLFWLFPGVLSEKKTLRHGYRSTHPFVRCASNACAGAGLRKR